MSDRSPWTWRSPPLAAGSHRLDVSCTGEVQFKVFDEPLPANADVLDVARAGAPPAVIRYSKRIRGAQLDYNVAAR